VASAIRSIEAVQAGRATEVVPRPEERPQPSKQ